MGWQHWQLIGKPPYNENITSFFNKINESPLKSLKKAFDWATSEWQFTPYGFLQTEIMRQVGKRQLRDTLRIILELQQTYFPQRKGCFFS